MESNSLAQLYINRDEIEVPDCNNINNIFNSQ